MTKVNTILVTGSSGQLGQSLHEISKQFSQYEMTFISQSELDLANTDNIKEYFQHHHYDVIINCAAFTAVDMAESDADLANAVNHLAVKELAEIAQQQASKLIHISTDYVFSGQQHRPYIESDEVEPQGVYGITKLKGEQAVLKLMLNNAMIIRTSWLYSEYGNNFVKTILKLGQKHDALNVIFDQIGTPTYAGDLAKAILTIISTTDFEKNQFSSAIYHYSNEGVCSWFDFARTIFELCHIDCSVNPIETKDYPTPAMRPHYSLLNKAKIKGTFNLSIPYWKDSLQVCLTKFRDNS